MKDLTKKLGASKPLVWAVVSKSDPRWNKEWRVTGYIIDGPPKELTDWVLKQAEELGDHPDDCMMSVWKED